MGDVRVKKVESYEVQYAGADEDFTELALSMLEDSGCTYAQPDQVVGDRVRKVKVTVTIEDLGIVDE